MKKKWMANVYYTCSMVVATGAVGCGGAIENSPDGWTSLAWTCAAILMGGFAVALAALGVVSEAPGEPEGAQEAEEHGETGKWEKGGVKDAL